MSFCPFVLLLAILPSYPFVLLPYCLFSIYISALLSICIRALLFIRPLALLSIYPFVFLSFSLFAFLYICPFVFCPFVLLLFCLFVCIESEDKKFQILLKWHCDWSPTIQIYSDVLMNWCTDVQMCWGATVLTCRFIQEDYWPQWIADSHLGFFIRNNFIVLSHQSSFVMFYNSTIFPNI